MVNALETLLGNLFMGIFGTPTMAGIVGLLLLIILGAALRLSFEGYLIMILPAAFLLANYGYLPEIIYYPMILLAGFIIFLAVMRLVNR